VASRCQRFDFRRIETGSIAAHLAMSVQGEGVKVDPQSLALLARLARGSMRDGITLVDQLISQAGEELTIQRTHELLGLADPETLVRLLGYIVDGDGARTLAELQRFYDAGGDVRQLVRALLGAIREAALLSVGYQDAEALGGAASAGLEKIGRAAGRNALLGLWRSLMEMEPELRKGADARLLLEVTLLSSMIQPIPVTVPPKPASEQAAGERLIEPAMDAEPAVSGSDARWEVLQQEPPRVAPAIADDPICKEAMNRFDATNVRVTPRGRA